MLLGDNASSGSPYKKTNISKSNQGSDHIVNIMLTPGEMRRNNSKNSINKYGKSAPRVQGLRAGSLDDDYGNEKIDYLA